MLTGNHKNIFNDAKVPWSEYRYYDPKTVGLDFEGMVADIEVLGVLAVRLSIIIFTSYLPFDDLCWV